MAKPVAVTVMAFLLFVGLLLLWAPFSFSQTSGVQPVGKVSNATVTSDAQTSGDYLVGVGKADITGYGSLEYIQKECTNN